MARAKDDDERPAGPQRREAPEGVGPDDSRAYTWYALRVMPQRELAAQRILKDYGFATFVPVSRRWEFSNRQTKVKWEKREVVRPIMPGWVFVGMAEHTPGWDRIVWVPLITGIIGQQGRPLVIPHDSVRREDGSIRRYGLRDLIWQQAGGAFDAPDYAKWQETKATFKPGDTVVTQMQDDLGEKIRAKVVEIDGRKVSLMLEKAFLGVLEVTGDATKLRKVE